MAFMESENEDLIKLNPLISLIHGACLVFIDSINTDNIPIDQTNPRDICMNFLFESIQNQLNLNLKELFYSNLFKIEENDSYFKCGPFSIQKGTQIDLNNLDNYKYCLTSTTTASNLQRVMRCLLMNSPIMLEGSPGVGKTSLVEALAKITRNKVIRINLSEQTDLNELFGADLPFNEQKFIWHDGPFLLALKKGYWIILDEINLASQSVLEGLNSCFDHRNEIYISELNKTFKVDKLKTKIFACQNPFIQGGGRKGLPKSFLNRFSKVYIDQMKHSDLLLIARNIYPKFEIEVLEKMILFNQKVCLEKRQNWEFNLRDLFRWCDLSQNATPGDFVYLIYANRFRNNLDKERVYEIFKEIFEYSAYKQEDSRIIRFSSSHLQIGQSFLKFNKSKNLAQKYSFTNRNLKYLESVAKCIEMNWMCILVGKSCTGKTSLIRMLASLTGNNLIEFSVNNSTDTSDLLGAFEKVKHLKQDLEYLNERIRSIYLEEINKSNFGFNLCQEYFEFMFESKRLFKELLNLDQDFDLLKNLVDLFEKNLKKFKIENSLLDLFDRIKNSVGIKGKEEKKKYEKMKFEWIDSSLVKAIQNGDWILIDNANFCNPSVLDRLNPLLERNGSLQINEKGKNQIF